MSTNRNTNGRGEYPFDRIVAGIEEARHDLGLSRAQAAQLAGLSHGQVQGLVRGSARSSLEGSLSTDRWCRVSLWLHRGCSHRGTMGCEGEPDVSRSRMVEPSFRILATLLITCGFGLDVWRWAAECVGTDA